jgi:hypothetical protein
MFVACSDDKTSNNPSSLAIDQTEMDVLAIGGKTLIDVNTDLAWNATVDADWLRISPASGNGSETVNVEIDKHSGLRRTAKITFTTGAITKTVNVLQRGQIPEMNFLGRDMSTPISNMATTGEGGVEMIIVRSNLMEWTVDTDADWIRILDVVDISGGSYIIIEDGNIYYEGVISTNVLMTKSVIVSIAANENLADRSGAIIFKDGDNFSDTVKVSQAGVRTYDSDGYLIVDNLPFRDKSKYELSAVPWKGQVGEWGKKFGVLTYKVTVTGSGKLKITDHESPTYNIWFLLYSDKEAADKGEDKKVADGDGTLEYAVTPGTYYIFGIMNTWYDDIAPLTTIDYDVEITYE